MSPPRRANFRSSQLKSGTSSISSAVSIQPGSLSPPPPPPDIFMRPISAAGVSYLWRRGRGPKGASERSAKKGWWAPRGDECESSGNGGLTTAATSRELMGNLKSSCPLCQNQIRSIKVCCFWWYSFPHSVSSSSHLLQKILRTMVLSSGFARARASCYHLGTDLKLSHCNGHSVSCSYLIE